MNPKTYIALLGICYDESSSFMQGAREAPPAIRQALHSASANLWTENGLHLDGASIEDCGDLAPGYCEEMRAQVERSLDGILDRGLRPIVLGGDHSITYPIIRSMAKKYPDLVLLDFDAHPDIYDEFEGNRYSHACPFSRIMEAGLVKRLVQVGIRTATAHQRSQAARFGVEMHEMKDWGEPFDLHSDSPVYISFDLDGLDPAFAPGVSHPEPGGLTTRQALTIIQGIRGPLVGADIVEYNPRKDPQNLTAMVCAKVLKEIAAKMLGQV